MPSAIELYDAAKITRDKAKSAVNELAEKLEEVIRALNEDAELLLAYPVGDDAFPDERTALDFMPTADVIHAAVEHLHEAEGKMNDAYAALSEVEKSYVKRE